MKTVKINKVTYVAIDTKTETCEGCAAENDSALCFLLPRGCSKDEIIWVNSTDLNYQREI